MRSLVLALVVAGCGGTDNPNGCDVAKAQGPSQRCCLAYGADACGANLFCGAFDGRTVPTCYVERSRADMTACTEDRQCTSGSCNLDQMKCRSLFGQPCTIEIGCATAPDGGRYACNPRGLRPLTCEPVSSQNGGLCGVDSDCGGGHCVMSQCSNGADGSVCATGSDCSGGHCVGGKCANGSLGAACATGSDCKSGACVSRVCGCATSRDCSVDKPKCVRGGCYMGWFDDPCVVDGDCNPMYPHCTGGKCSAGIPLGQSCSMSSQCALQYAQLTQNPIPVVCDDTKHTCAIISGGLCTSSSGSNCQMGTTCKPANVGKCGGASGATCSGYECCTSTSCFETCYDGATCQ
jgi:hypothetical protein